MVKIGHSRKYVEYFSASSVAEVQMSFRSFRRCARNHARRRASAWSEAAAATGLRSLHCRAYCEAYTAEPTAELTVEPLLRSLP